MDISVIFFLLHGLLLYPAGGMPLPVPLHEEIIGRGCTRTGKEGASVPMLIGITTTFDEDNGSERVNVEYLEHLTAVGAAPVLIPSVPGDDAANVAAARAVIEHVDALVLSGGGDIEPALYGNAARLPQTIHVSRTRDALEIALTRLAYDHDLPILGICRGMQVMNVARGGTLHQDMKAGGLTAVDHQQDPPYQTAHQRISVGRNSIVGRALCKPDTERATIHGTCRAAAVENGDPTCPLAVNSMHHQAIDILAPGLVVSALSEDGIIEGIEDPTRRFFVGVQWHPEYLANNAPLFRALANAARFR